MTTRNNLNTMISWTSDLNNFLYLDQFAAINNHDCQRSRATSRRTVPGILTGSNANGVSV